MTAKLLETLSAPLFHAAQPRHLKAGERLFASGMPAMAATCSPKDYSR